MQLFFVRGQAHAAEFEGGVVEDGVVDVAGVVEEVAGDGGFGGDGGGGEAEVGVVGEDLLVDGRVVDGDGGDGGGQGDLGAGGALFGEHAALEFLVGGGVAGVVVGGDEEDADVVEGEGFVGGVGDDDADGHEAVVEVVEAGIGSGFGAVAGLGGDGDAVEGLVQGVFVGGRGGRWGAGLVAGAGGGEGQKTEARGDEAAEDKGEGTGAHATDYAPPDYALEDGWAAGAVSG